MKCSKIMGIKLSTYFWSRSIYERWDLGLEKCVRKGCEIHEEEKRKRDLKNNKEVVVRPVV